MQIVDTAPDDFLDSIEDDTVRETMKAVDATIVAALPDRRRVLWQGVSWGGTDQSIIGYGDITQPRPRGKDVEWFLVGLARQKSTYSLYLNAVRDGAYLGRWYGGRLGKVKLGAASIGFTRLEHLDLEVLAEMLREADGLTPTDPE